MLERDTLKLTPILCAAAVALSLSAIAQEATPLRSAELGECYNTCGAQSLDLRVKMADLKAKVYWDMWRASGALTQTAWDTFIDAWREMVCELDQNAALGAFQCKHGCSDLENESGMTRSNSRTVFLHAYAEVFSDVKASGLWPSAWRERPRAGTEAFSTACRAYFGLEVQARALSELPKHAE